METKPHPSNLTHPSLIQQKQEAPLFQLTLTFPVATGPNLHQIQSKTLTQQPATQAMTYLNIPNICPTSPHCRRLELLDDPFATILRRSSSQVPKPRGQPKTHFQPPRRSAAAQRSAAGTFSHALGEILRRGERAP